MCEVRVIGHRHNLPHGLARPPPLSRWTPGRRMLRRSRWRRRAGLPTVRPGRAAGFNLGRSGDAHEHHIGGLGHFLRGLCGAGALRISPRSAGCRSARAGHRMPVFHHIFRQAMPHQAHTDKTQFSCQSFQFLHGQYAWSIFTSQQCTRAAIGQSASTRSPRSTPVRRRGAVDRSGRHSIRCRRAKLHRHPAHQNTGSSAAFA